MSWAYYIGGVDIRVCNVNFEDYYLNMAELLLR